MQDERALLARLEAANTEGLAHLLLLATPAEEKVLRIYLGDDRFRRLRNLVLRREMTRGERRQQPVPNVVVIPGVLGSELTSLDREQQRERVWLSPHQIVAGHLARLQLDSQGLGETDTRYAIQVSGIIKRYYGELILSLAEHCNVQAFWYDWRKDFRLAAAQLQASIDNWFPAGEPVHLVAHAAGGLVARAYLHQFPHRWALGHSKLIMIGVPNYGVYTAPQALTGHLQLIQWIDLLDAQHDRVDFRELVKTFPSLYQLLPAPDVPHLPVLDPAHEVARLYEAETFGPDLNISQTHLTNAKEFHKLLATSHVDGMRMIYLAGCEQSTYVGINIDRLKEFALHGTTTDQADAEYLLKAYELGLNGDGTVSHARGVLFDADRKPIPAYGVSARHGDLCSHPKILLGIKQLLGLPEGQRPDDPAVVAEIANGSGLQPLTVEELNGQPSRRTRQSKQSQTKDALQKATRKLEEQKRAFAALVRRVNVRSGDDTATRHLISVEERDIEEQLTAGFLSGSTERAYATYQSIELPAPKIKINLVRQDITDTVLTIPGATATIDAIAVGHYSGSKPHGLMRTLDRKISRTLDIQRGLAPATAAISDDDFSEFEEVNQGEAEDADLLLTQYTQRGTIRGDLAHTFFLTDPRQLARTVAIAGMGEPGRFGVPELTVLVRELCWSLGRVGKHRLATVLIGAGRENLAVADAVTGWVRGIKLAISGLSNTGEAGKQSRALQEITFFITDPRKCIAFDEALLREKKRLENRNRMEIEYTALTSEQKQEFRERALDYVQRQLKLQMGTLQQEERQTEPAPTRITVSVEGNKYRFGAITDQASIPEREIPLDPALVRCANDELAAASDPARQLDLGQFMQRLLIPADLRNQLTSSAPLVIMLDAATARIHWELLAQSDPTTDANDVVSDEPQFRFLATSRGFTRQLRTLFAPPPEPPPPTRRHLRVLVVADPAVDAHLPGAEEEGIAVADLFEQFNIIHAQSSNRVEVVRLFGPREATRTAVLHHLMMRTYDVLHFAGHCLYDPKTPAASGWIFSNGERLSAYEFTRIDRSPAFVFSNACESGITPARSDERSVDLAPSFAESFFGRGVTNFVCTAWPVEDRAARDFALTLYAGLLGLRPNRQPPSPSAFTGPAYLPDKPLPMYLAMQHARVEIATPPSDTRTWGAYQHYGNPYFRFFDPAGMMVKAEQPSPVVATDAAGDPQQNGARRGAARKTQQKAQTG